MYINEMAWDVCVGDKSGRGELPADRTPCDDHGCLWYLPGGEC